MRARTSHLPDASSSSQSLAYGFSEVRSRLYSRSLWHLSAGARDDTKEEQRRLDNGSHVRPRPLTRLLLQLDDADRNLAVGGRASVRCQL
jgi:hypothetical protein